MRVVASESRLSDQGPDRRVFLFLVAYRWASLFPALWLFFQRPDFPAGRIALPVLLVAAGNALLVTLFYRRLNRWLIRRPFLLGVDLLFTAGLIAISGGTHSSYYLYALSPLLAGAFLFQVRGAVVISAVYTILYLAALTTARWLNAPPADPNQLFTQLAGIWLIPVLFSYPAILISRLRETRDALKSAHDDLTQQNADLSRVHRQLEIIHDLTVLLQAAPDLTTVQRRVLKVLTEDLGFDRAAVGLVDPASQELGEWQVYPSSTMADGEKFAIDESSPAWQEKGPWLSLPLRLREHPVGVLLVSIVGGEESLTGQQQEMLRVVSSQAAIALGTTMVCIDRTRRLTVEQERNRIARDIHDTIAQSLFGIVFSLDACISMLPQASERVKTELVELRALASQARNEVRRSIFDLWPAELTLERFQTDLASYVSQCCHPHSFAVDFTTSGDFERLSPVIRRTLFRITQEALVNAARHGGVETAQVCLGVEADLVHLCIRDQGRGFDSETVLGRKQAGDRYGLHGIQARIQALGGVSEIYSREQQGTLILASLPLQP